MAYVKQYRFKAKVSQSSEIHLGRSIFQQICINANLATLTKKPIEHPFQSKIEYINTTDIDDVSEACTLPKNNLRNIMKHIHSSECTRPDLSIISTKVPEKIKKLVQGKSSLDTRQYTVNIYH